MMFGRLGYDLTLTREFFERKLKHRFPQADSKLLYDTWKASSQIIPQVNRFFFRINDSMFSPEGCISRGGFLAVDDSFFKYGPLEGSGILSVHEFADAVLTDKPFDGVTPLEVADSLDVSADRTLQGVASMRVQTSPDQKEFLSTLSDLESMALLGRYYASKIRGAAELAVYRADPKRRFHHERAVAHFNQAVTDWEAYARSATSQYNSQLFSRTHYLDWWKILVDVKEEAQSVQDEEGAPKQLTSTEPSTKGLSR
jgi:hypothetical protein